MKHCPRCNETKELDLFSNAKARKDGKNVYCRACCKQYREENQEIVNGNRVRRWKENPEYREKYLAYHRERYIREKDIIRAYQANHYSIPENKLTYLVAQARWRAEKEGIPFDISISDLLPLPTHCKYLGIELTSKHRHGRLDTNMSLDKIEPNKGYVKGNVQIISEKANRMKNDATLPELITFANNIIKEHTL